MATFAVTCANCLHQRTFPTQEQASEDAAAHAQANPTHSPMVHQERE